MLFTILLHLTFYKPPTRLDVILKTRDNVKPLVTTCSVIPTSIIKLHHADTLLQPSCTQATKHIIGQALQSTPTRQTSFSNLPLLHKWCSSLTRKFLMRNLNVTSSLGSLMALTFDILELKSKSNTIPVHCPETFCQCFCKTIVMQVSIDYP